MSAKRWAQMRGTRCANVVEAEGEPAEGGPWLDVTGKVVGPGCTTPDGGATWLPATAQVAEVTPRQARLALAAAGKLAAVDAAIGALSEPARTQARITWDYSTMVQRDNPVLLALAAALGMTDAEVDALFAAAAAL